MSNYRNIEPDRYAAIFAGLSNPNRLRLFLRLLECCGVASCRCDPDTGACVGDLADGLDIAASTVSHHLKELRQCGLIEMRRRGRTVECHVRQDVLAEARALLEAVA